jgi:ectoine hydroxylase-related dioxygenase (phytanoyl-CoA dioxygenase family)
MPRAIFASTELNFDFQRKGYIVIRELLNKEEIQQLLLTYENFKQEALSPFHTTHFSTNKHYKKVSHEVISKTVFSKASKYLNEYRPLFGNFMIKNPDPNVSLDIHSDWTYVDEDRFQSLAIWIPLVDTNENNGTFGLVEQSHKVTNKIRGPLIIESSRNKNEYWAKKYGTLLNMKAGDAVLYHHGLLHFSPPNKTNQTRPAINLTVVPKEAYCIHYCIPEGASEIEMYAVEGTDFYLNYTHFQRPDHRLPAKFYPKSIIHPIDKKMNWFGIKKYLT